MANEGLRGKNDISHDEYSVESKAPVFLAVPKTDLFLVEGETILILFI